MFTRETLTALALTGLAAAAAGSVAGQSQAAVLSPVGDSWVNENFPNSNETAKAFLSTVRENPVGAAEESWVAFLTFDISGVSIASMTDATLKLNVTDGDFESGDLLLYGAKDGSGIDTLGDGIPAKWLEVSANSELKAATSTPLYGDIIDDVTGVPDATVFEALPNLWTFGDTALGPNDAVAVSGAQLLEFLQNDTNGRIVFAIQSSDSSFKAVHSIEAADESLRPTLTLVPEPASLAMIGVGALALVTRSRRG